VNASSDDKEAEAEVTLAPTPLTRALGQSEQVKDKVEECAADLSSVNAVLKQEIAEREAPHEVERAVNQNEEVEVKVQECADDLAIVNTALSEGIDERRSLEHDLSRSKAALYESKAREKKSRRLALHDAVTGLANRSLFNDRLSHALAQAQRHRWRLAVMFIDLDDFKNVNDTYGHEVGDRVLQMVAQRLRGSVRGGDTVSRRGGDEFLLLMLEAKDEGSVAALAAKIIDNIAEACDVEGGSVRVRPSIGIALYPEDGQCAQDLLKNADKAMYAAKQQKKGLLLYSQVAAP
jgi:diguanylate cyclase (GGDEF)-like protein